MRIAIFFLIFFTHTTLFSLDYKVEIQGIPEQEILTSVKEGSQAIQLKNKKPVASYQALRKRAEGDLQKIVDTCRYYGYLDTEANFTILRAICPTVVFKVDLGPLYTIKQITVVQSGKSSPRSAPKFARTDEILKSEETIILDLKKQGYAFCKSISKEITADALDHTVSIVFYVDMGPEVHFGKTTILGKSSIKSWRIKKHLQWKEGELYNQEKLEQAQQNLEKSGLFSSVIITEKVDTAKENLEKGKAEIPIEVNLQEAKHKSFGAGVSYTTSKGPGVRATWENRNSRGRGDKLSFQTELWQKFQNARLCLRQPHFRSYNQDRIWLLEFDRQDTLAYFKEALSGSLLFERYLNDKVSLFWGGKLESLRSKTIEEKATYYLAKLPLGIRWNNSNNLLDPLHGQVVHTRLTPSYQFLAPQFGYVTHATTLISYYSFFRDKMTLAAKANFGNIFGAAKHTIPTPDRFFSGTENTLRGYRYLTVSPLGHKNKPVGGRSLLAGSLEARMRTNSGFGWVLFYDVGNVYSANLPEIGKGVLQSVGAGLRYATPIGPLRLDIACPLNPRRKIDPAFQIYFSIGQSF
ncbi:MAG: hypothetical protein JWO53_211 [Chlamydiia bacterium]|nr:hypothetical protein [Chlamydiia bacterium]